MGTIVPKLSFIRKVKGEIFVIGVVAARQKRGLPLCDVRFSVVGPVPQRGMSHHRNVAGAVFPFFAPQ